MNFNAVTSRIIESAITVHREMGPGLLESVYQKCLVLELNERGLDVRVQVPIPICYKGNPIGGETLRLDLLVNNEVIVELKSVTQVQAVHVKQLLTYLRLAKKSLGLVINFNEALLKNGITRVVNDYKETVSVISPTQVNEVNGRDI